MSILSLSTRLLSDPKLAFTLYNRYDKLIKEVEKKGLIIEKEWIDDYQNFLEDNITGFLKLYDEAPGKKIGLYLLDPKLGYTKGNCNWQRGPGRNYTKTISFQSGTYSKRELAIKFGLTTNVFNKQYDLAINKQAFLENLEKNPGRSYSKNPRRPNTYIIYNGKTVTVSEIIRLFKSKKLRLSRQGIHQKINIKRAKLGLDKNEAIEMTSKDILLNNYNRLYLPKNASEKIIQYI